MYMFMEMSLHKLATCVCVCFERERRGGGGGVTPWPTQKHPLRMLLFLFFGTSRNLYLLVVSSLQPPPYLTYNIIGLLFFLL